MVHSLFWSVPCFGPFSLLVHSVVRRLSLSHVNPIAVVHIYRPVYDSCMVNRCQNVSRDGKDLRVHPKPE